MSGGGYPIPHFYHSPSFPFLLNIMAVSADFSTGSMFHILWSAEGIVIWIHLKECVSRRMTTQNLQRGADSGKKDWSLSTTTSVLFILKVLELFYIKKGLCFPNVVLPHHIKEVSMHFPREVVFGDAHWTTKQCIGQQNAWLHIIVISGDETHLDLGGNHHGLFHALCI